MTISSPKYDIFNTNPLIETLIETSAIANDERNKAVRRAVGNLIGKTRNIVGKRFGFGLKVAGLPSAAQI